MNAADISPLVGRHFVSKSFNVARILRLDEGAIRAHWNHKPTAEDLDEIELWAIGILGRVEFTRNIGLATERDALSAWKRKV